MSDVFISYAREDSDFVRRLQAALAEAQRETWVDWQGIAPTAAWWDEILRAIDAADAAVFIVSPDWLASEVCALELDHAEARRKRLIPVVCADVPEGSVPEALARLNWVLMRAADPFDAALQRLLQALDTDLEHVRAHTRLTVRAVEWSGQGRSRDLLLSGTDLAEAERWLGRAASFGKPAPTPLQAEYLARSRQTATRRQRLSFGAVLVALVVAVGLAIWAELARREADAQREEALRQRNAAEARQLAARAAYLQNAEPGLSQLAVLVAAESMRQLPNVEADQVLRQALATLAPRIGEMPHGGVDHPARVTGDTSRLALADARGMLRVFDLSLRTEELLAPIGGGIEGVELSGNGRLTITRSRDGVRILDAGDAAPRRDWHEVRHDCPREAHAVAPAYWGDHVAVACADTVVLYDAADWSRQEVALRDPVALAFSPDTRTLRLAVLDAEGTVHLYDEALRPLAQVVEQPPGGATRWMRCCQGLLRYSERGDWLAVANPRRTRGAHHRHDLNGPRVRFTRDCRWLAVADVGGIRIHAPLEGVQRLSIEGGIGGRGDLQFSPSGRWLIVSDEFAPARFWDTATWQAVPLPADCEARDPALDDGQTVVALRCKESVLVFDLAARRELGRVPVGHGSFQFTPGGLLVSEPERLRLLSLPGLTPSASAAVATDVGADLAVSPDRRWVARSGGKATALWSLNGLQPVGRVDHAQDGQGSTRARFSADGVWLALSGPAPLRLYRTDGLRPVLAIDHSGPATAVGFDAAGEQIAVGAMQQRGVDERRSNLTVWRIADARAVARIEGIDAGVFADDAIVAGGRRYPLGTKALVAAACRLVIRNMTQREWRREIPGRPWQATCPAFGEPAAAVPDWER